MAWFSYFAIAFGVSFLLNRLVIWIYRRFETKKELRSFFRWGGLAVIPSFVFTVLINPEIVITNKILAILLASLLAGFFGALDDFKNFSWKIQLAFQVFLGILLVWLGFEIGVISFGGELLFETNYFQVEIIGKTISLLNTTLVVFWLIGIINAINWLDGSDGLLSITAILALLAIFFVSLRPEVNQPAVAILALIGSGAFLGFGVFNFPPAKIIAGTGGSYFAGVLLASLAIIAGTKIATTMVVLALPIIDFIWVTVERRKAGKSIFQKEPGERHLHYKFLKNGWSERGVLLVYFCFLGAALLISLFVFNQAHKLILLTVELIMILTLLFSLTRRNEKIKNQK
ncbi:MAG: glycosyltransferase family 4 protein [Patescibacteria group bacterium]